MFLWEPRKNHSYVVANDGLEFYRCLSLIVLFFLHVSYFRHADLIYQYVLAIIIPMTNKEIAAKINTLRKEANLTQVNFGKEVIHVSQATASKKLNGQIPFSVEEIFECAERFNVSTEYLYGREKEKTLEPV